MKPVCRLCVLPLDFPHASPDGSGVCHFCREFRDAPRGASAMEKYRKEFEVLLRNRRRGEYDLLMCFSGGKDSAYTLALLKKKYSLKILALTLDNGFVASGAKENVATVCGALGVDHLYFTPEAKLMKKIFGASLKKSPYPQASTERASAVCVSCMGFLKYAALKTAIEKEIPFIGYGWTPGQAPVTSSVLRFDAAMLRRLQETVKTPMERLAGESLDAYFLAERHFSDGEKIPHLVHPAAFFPYREKDIYAEIARLGWKKPAGLDANSTNCLLNSLAVVTHEKNFGFHPYAFEIARLVREGILSRSEGLKRLSARPPARTVRDARGKLSL